MRLSEIRLIIEQNIGNLLIQGKDYPHDKNMMLVGNVRTTMNAINNLSRISYFQKDVKLLEKIQDVALIMTDTEITVPRVKANQFLQIISRIKSDCTIVSSLISSIIPQMNDNTICVKLPEENENSRITATELSEIAKGISFLFDTITLSEGRNERVEFVGVEPGSSWMYFFVTGTISIGIINLFLDQIFEIFKKVLEFKEVRLKLKHMDVQHEISEDISAYTKKLCEKAVKQLEDDNHIHPDDETREKYIQSMGKCIKLLDMRTEIYPSLSAPKEKQETVTDYFQKIKSISEKLLLLESADRVPEQNQHEDNLTYKGKKRKGEENSSSD